MNGRIDFYTKVHKALRASLFRFSQEAAAMDYTDADAVRALAGALSALLDRLSSHAAHEARFIHPLLAAKTGRAAFDAEHDALEAQQADLAGALALVRTVEPAERHVHGLAFYRAFNGFLAAYLQHLEREEATMPILWECCSDAELGGVMAAFGASRAFGEVLSDFGWMLPALSAPEQAELIRGLSQRA